MDFKTATVQSMLSNHNAMKLEISNGRKFGKLINTQKLDNTFLNNKQVNKELRREIKKHFELKKLKVQVTRVQRKDHRFFSVHSDILNFSA